MTNTIAKEIALKLLQIKAIKLNPDKPFTWASGWKSPIYCDNRLSLSFPELRSEIKHRIVDTIKKNFSEVEAIAGVATAGIPQGALVADEMKLPFLYVRSSAKGHGLENQVEGKLVEGQKIVVLEDLISTGGSSIKAVKTLRAAGIEVLGMVAIFTYQFPIADESLKLENIPTITLSNYSSLLEIALEQKFIQNSDMEMLKEWRTSPETWSPGK